MQTEEKYCKFDNHYTVVIAICAMLVLMGMMSGCVSNLQNKTTTVVYDIPTGKISQVTETIKEESGWPLKGKASTIRSNGFGGSITPAADPTTGALPGVQIFKAGLDVDTLPVPDLDEVFKTLAAQGKLPADFVVWSETLNADKSLWGAELSNFYYTRKGGGTMTVDPAISIVYSVSGTLPAQPSPAATPAPVAAKAASTPALSAQSAPAASGLDMDTITDQAKDWISKPENQAQAKSWLSQAWSWISGLF